MTRAIVMLKALCAKRVLLELCKSIGISYKYTHGVSKGFKAPSYDLMKKMQDLIPVEYWFEEADNAFKDEVKKTLYYEDEDNPIVIDLSEDSFKTERDEMIEKAQKKKDIKRQRSHYRM